jgi:hypothetical protein
MGPLDKIGSPIAGRLSLAQNAKDGDGRGEKVELECLRLKVNLGDR